jgi:hypothetical protein
LRRRRVSIKDVLRVIDRPDQVLPTVKGRKIFQSLLRPRKLLLRVIVKEDLTAYHVITTYKTSQVAKYWRTP